MSETDRRHWDERYRSSGLAPVGDKSAPPALATAAHLIPTAGTALELACGRGRAAVWLAKRGMQVLGVDVSPVAVELARALAEAEGVSDRCAFAVADLDEGLPAGPPVALIMCHLFRDPRLDRAIVERLAPGGMLAIAVLSEVDAEPGSYRARRGELAEAFTDLRCLAAGEGDGVAWLVGERG